MVDEVAIRERELNPGDADPYRAPAAESPPAGKRGTGRLVLRILQWTLGLPIVLLGLLQCGIGAIFLALSFVTDVGLPRPLMALLVGHGLMLALPGTLLCLGRSWAAWFPLALSLLYLAAWLAEPNAVFLVLGSLLAGFPIAILLLAVVFPRARG